MAGANFSWPRPYLTHRPSGARFVYLAFEVDVIYLVREQRWSLCLMVLQPASIPVVARARHHGSPTA